MLVQVSRLELTICKSPDLRTNFYLKINLHLIRIPLIFLFEILHHGTLQNPGPTRS